MASSGRGSSDEPSVAPGNAGSNLPPESALRNQKFADSPLEGDGFEPSVPRKFLWCPVRSHAIRLPQNKPASLATGTDGSNPSPSAGESVLTSAQPRIRLRTPRLGGVCAWAGTREGDG